MRQLCVIIASIFDVINEVVLATAQLAKFYLGNRSFALLAAMSQKSKKQDRQDNAG